MGWNDEKYFQQIVYGYKDKDKNRKYKKPTIDYLFKGINYAIANYDYINNQYEEILKFVTKHLILSKKVL